MGGCISGPHEHVGHEDWADRAESQVWGGNERFAGCVEIPGVSAIGDALVGARGWKSGPVLRERDAILGTSECKAWEVVERHRERMKRAWRILGDS